SVPSPTRRAGQHQYPTRSLSAAFAQASRNRAATPTARGANAPIGLLPASHGDLAPSQGANTPHAGEKPRCGAFARRSERRSWCGARCPAETSQDAGGTGTELNDVVPLATVKPRPVTLLA